MTVKAPFDANAEHSADGPRSHLRRMLTFGAAFLPLGQLPAIDRLTGRSTDWLLKNVSVTASAGGAWDPLVVGPPPAVDDVGDSAAIFVAADGSDGDGTRERPLATLAEGLAAASRAGKQVVALKGGDTFRVTASTHLGAEHNGMLVRAYGQGKPLVTGAAALSDWQPHPSLRDCFYSTDARPPDRRCFILSIDGRRFPQAARFTAYNDYSGQKFADGWEDARQAVIGLRQADGDVSRKRGRFDGRDGEMIAVDEIGPHTWMACRKGLNDRKANGYWWYGHAIDGFDPGRQAFELGSMLWATMAEDKAKRDKFHDSGCIGVLFNTPAWLAHPANPSGAYAWDPSVGSDGAVVVKWQPGAADLQDRAVELNLLADPVIDTGGSTASFQDIIFDGSAMSRLQLQGAAEQAPLVRCWGENARTGEFRRCVFRNASVGILLEGANASKRLSSCLIRGCELAGIHLTRRVEDMVVEHCEFVPEFTFNRAAASVRCYTRSMRTLIQYNRFHSSWGPAVEGTCGDVDGYRFYRNSLERVCRSSHDMGAHYMVRDRRLEGSPPSGFAAAVEENFFDQCRCEGEFKFDRDTGTLLPVNEYEADNTGGAYWDNGAEYNITDRNMIIGPSTRGIKFNLFNDFVEGSYVRHNVVVSTAPEGLADNAYSMLQLNNHEGGRIEIESNFFVLQNADRSGRQTFVQDSPYLSGSQGNNVVALIDQPGQWANEVRIDDLSAVWANGPDSPGPIRADCVCFDAPINLWRGFEAGGSFWTEVAKAGFE